jgi:hypothetical protein
MTTIDQPDDMSLEEIQSAAGRARALLHHIKMSREAQPDRIEEARAAADEARGWAIIEEPWDTQWTAVPSFTSGGELAGSMSIPNMTAKELFGARLAFDMLDCGDDDDRINAVQSRFFSMVHGDPGMAFLLFASALSTVASVVVPQLLDDLEHHGSNYDARVMLAEARAKAWHGRVSELRDQGSGGTSVSGDTDWDSDQPW